MNDDRQPFEPAEIPVQRTPAARCLPLALDVPWPPTQRFTPADAVILSKLAIAWEAPDAGN